MYIWLAVGVRADWTLLTSYCVVVGQNGGSLTMELFTLSLVTNQSDVDGVFSIGVWEIARALGALVVVIALSILVLWFYGRRMSHLHSKVMHVVDMIPLERNARIYLVEVADTYVLVGVSREKLTHLCTLGKKPEVNLEAVSSASDGVGDIGLRDFSGFLERAIERMRPDRNDTKTQETDRETID